MRKLFSLTSLIMVSMLVLAACVMPTAPAAEAPADDSMAEESMAEESMDDEAMDEEMMSADIVDTAVAAGDFTTLVAAVEAAGLVETLKGEGPFTVFAPTDDAFAALPEGTVTTLLEDPTGALTDILLYHVVSGKVMAADVVGMDGAMVETVGGSSFTITVDGDSVMVDGANVVATDIETSNGVIHVIDAVIMPAAGDEEAMAEPTAEPEEESMDEEMMSADIIDTAVAADNFTTLVAAVEAAGLVETLKGEGPFTVFAPTDDAFAALPEGTVDSLLEDPTGALTDIILYHVVSGKVMAADVVGMDGAMVETVGGSSFTITVDGDSVMVDGANVVATDIETSNGVIHVIDAVIIPGE